MADITITEGDTLEVDYSLENTGDGTGTFDPRLLVQGVQEDQDTGIALDPAQTATGTLQWPTESGDAVTDALAEAVTDDTSDSILVTVEDAIPDSVVDNFEDADADPAGVYESGETIADYYQGDTGSYGRQSTDAIEASHSLASTVTDSLQTIVSEPGDGLPRYPDPGDTIGFLVRDPTNNPNPSVLFAAELDSGDLFGYGATVVQQFNEIRIRKFDADSGTTQDSASASISTDEWYWGEIDTPTTTDGSMEFRLSELDSGLTEGPSLGSVSITDTDFADNRGIGLSRLSSSGSGATLDWQRIL